MRKDALDKLAELLEVLAANLARLAGRRSDGLLISLNKASIDAASRYKPTLINHRRLRQLLDLMEAAGIIAILKGGDRRVQISSDDGGTWVRATTIITLRSHYDQLAALNKAKALRHRLNTERIILRTQHKGCEYDDTDQTRQFRHEATAINEHMAGHPVLYSGSLPVDPSSTVVCRIFNDTFERGGRLYGHYAQNLPKAEREHLSIDGEPLADLDYQAMHYWLLHAEAGVTPLNLRDPFLLPGYEDHRKLIKTASYAILNASHRLRNYPTGLIELASPGMLWRDVEEAVLDRLPIIKAHAYTGIGLVLQRRESDVLIKVLTELIRFNIGFLPMHDGIMVPSSKAEVTATTMSRVYREATGFDISVTNKSIETTTNRHAA